MYPASSAAETASSRAVTASAYSARTARMASSAPTESAAIARPSTIAYGRCVIRWRFVAPAGSAS